ncbi:MAG: gamma-glutamyltransferase family protein [Natronospirillum sp.]|uniref:gamma-glutamyltransferase family protein n=1 Tax=Natronospirillum sp. TaxID=2812955 RepID=UPI0025DE6A45|nr:gamma-glutamyltransferase family protein [Natronospirillum sp.]MCH8551175.1 gamma-glutamyltransferase family protein [Natronospirillum sp.]
MMTDPHFLPYPSSRMPVVGHRGMVATSQPQAAKAGMQILQAGGNAIDAAIATAAALTVTEPTSNGIGGDVFAIAWVNGEWHGLNGSGPAPAGMTPEAVRAQGHDTIPDHGLLPVTVPGGPASWAALSARLGKLPFADLLQPAIDLAQHGFAVSPVTSRLWARAVSKYGHYDRPEFTPWFEHFAPGHAAPLTGDVWRSADTARTLTRIAESKSRDFYQGELAQQMDDFMQRHGGLLRASDLAAFEPEWVTPIGQAYRDHTVLELPPNGSGLIALQALGILEQLSAATPSDPVEGLHQRIEAVKLAFSDGLHYITEPTAMPLSADELLAPAYLAERAGLIGQDALEPHWGKPPQGGTVYLATADEQGNMVSFIQSNYEGFGSGMVVPGTGISLQNRGVSFSLDPKAINTLVPGRRPYHTIIPGFLSRNGKPVGPFGVMGGDMQPQGHVQVVCAMLDDHLNPQAALDQPRWRWVGGRTILVEPHFPDHLAQALARRGHEVHKQTESLSFGRGQIILRQTATGSYIAGTEPRADGVALPW